MQDAGLELESFMFIKHRQWFQFQLVVGIWSA